MRLPNLRAATAKHHTTLGERLECDWLNVVASSVSALDAPAFLSSAATHITNVVRDAVFSTFPLTGAAPLRTKSILRMQSLRRDATALHLTRNLHSNSIHPTRCPHWVHLFRHCSRHHGIVWSCDIRYESLLLWMNETQQIIRHTRWTIKQEQRRLVRSRRPRVETNPAASVHRMLRSDELPPQLYSVINSKDELTRTPVELQQTMVNHFTNVFAIPSELEPPPAAVPILISKPDVDPAWYEGLMAPVTETELLSVPNDTPLLTAPGLDGVSTSAWKIAITQSPTTCERVLDLFNDCLCV